MNQPTANARLEFSPSRQFPNWLAEQRLALAFTTYQAGKLFLVGLQPDGRLSIFERTLNRCLGLWTDTQSLYLSTLYQIWRFENALDADQTYEGYDCCFVPRVGWVTGDLDAHDLAVDATGRLVFVNTLFACLATVSETHSFTPLWQPPFISRLAAEDRCHLNGLAMQDGKPAWVTAVSRTDIAEGWREHRQNGGCVVEVASGEVAAAGLSMPHSPRWYRGKLWLHNSGSGEFGYVDLAAGRFVPVAFCPGYLRGLSFWGDFAVAGLSKPRRDRAFAGLALQERLEKEGVGARCGLVVIDLKRGDAVHWLRIEGEVIEELYDVSVLSGVRRPMAIGFVSDEVRRMLSVGSGPGL
ncbi:TIGR03032 family protein [Candidatus Cyanaurora vandensis]|uniref:TIGR03032 family protein n=1 Tax=Candidatus Cyanaurora vandensis TaxID=2714958 RepID=UPI00257F624C|nr:TIGR03032 family protein [Candidatus Cyanaurora vandensis]